MKGILFVDFAHIFDFYSILLVKRYKGLDVKDEEIQSIYHSLIAQIGESKINNILKSAEFDAMVNANMQIFDFVDSQADSPAQKANYKRFECKKNLQNKFFGELTEIKN